MAASDMLNGHQFSLFGPQHEQLSMDFPPHPPSFAAPAKVAPSTARPRSVDWHTPVRQSAFNSRLRTNRTLGGAR